VADEQDCAPLAGDIAHFTQAFTLEFRIPHRQDFVHHKDLWLHMRRNCKSQPQIHTARITFHRCVDEFLDTAEKVIFDISEQKIKQSFVAVGDMITDTLKTIDKLYQRKEMVTGVPTGYDDLDKITAGLQPSELVIVAGRPGMGKTAFMLSAAKTAAQVHKKHVAVFSLEMANEQVVQRLIAQETGIDIHHLRTGKLNEDEWPLFAHAIEVLGDARIFLDDTPGLTPLQLRTKCRRLHLEFRIDLVLVDYLQLMSGGIRSENRVQEVSYISRNLKMLARELNVPLLAAAQLSRAVEQRADKEPQLSDLRESGSLEQDADVVMFIHRPDMYDQDTLRPNVTQVKIAKHRNGPTGTIELIFRSQLAKFENAATRSYDLSKVK